MKIAPQVALVQHVFIDIVKFTQGRSVEDQARLVGLMNNAVLLSLKEEKIERANCILLPTGDGMCVSLRNPEPYDIGVRLARRLLEIVAQQTSEDKPVSQKYALRIGVNQNHDNLLFDINKNINIAGRGINMAQRIMSLADDSQIFVGESVYEVLRERESYHDLFRSYAPLDKHGNKFSAHQLVDGRDSSLNCDHPVAFAQKKVPPLKLSRYAAHYIFNAEKYRDFIAGKLKKSNEDSCVVSLLHFLTKDSIAQEEALPTDNPIVIADIDEDGTPNTFYEHLDETSVFVVGEVVETVNRELSQFASFFEKRFISYHKIFGNEKGLKEVESEYPSLWDRLAVS